jgi:hypothetical protein
MTRDAKPLTATEIEERRASALDLLKRWSAEKPTSPESDYRKRQALERCLSDLRLLATIDKQAAEIARLRSMGFEFGSEGRSMGTKNNPGEFDCYAKLEPDEPYFLVKSTDPLAPVIVELWALLAELHSGGGRKVEEARQCAHAMRAWRAQQLGGCPVDSRSADALLDTGEVER